MDWISQLVQAGSLVLEVAETLDAIGTPARLRVRAASASDERAPRDLEGCASDAAVALLLAAATGANAASTQVVDQLKAINKRLDAIEQTMGHMQKQLAEIEKRTKRIDVKVAEAHLRESIRHANREAWKDGALRCSALVDLSDDVDGLLETVEGFGLLDTSVRLTTDVRHAVRSLAYALFALRTLVFQLHNRRVGADPTRVVVVQPVDDYVGDVQNLTIAAFVSNRVLQDVIPAIHASSSKWIKSNFSFGDDSDCAKFSAMFDKHGSVPLVAALSMLPGARLVTSVPEPFFKTEDLRDLSRKLRLLVGAWLWKSDGGALFRLQSELSALRDGYAYSFVSEEERVFAEGVAPAERVVFTL